MNEHWCTYCQGVNAHNCQFNANMPRQHVYITNSTAQPAQAVPMLSDAEIALIVADCSASAHRQDDFSFARAIEQAVLAKIGIVGKEGGNV